MALIHYQVPIVPDKIIHLLFSEKTLNNSDVDYPAELPFSTPNIAELTQDSVQQVASAVKSIDRGVAALWTKMSVFTFLAAMR